MFYLCNENKGAVQLHSLNSAVALLSQSLHIQEYLIVQKLRIELQTLKFSEMSDQSVGRKAEILLGFLDRWLFISKASVEFSRVITAGIKMFKHLDDLPYFLFQESELFLTVPRSVMMTTASARATALGRASFYCCINSLNWCSFHFTRHSSS